MRATYANCGHWTKAPKKKLNEILKTVGLKIPKLASHSIKKTRTRTPMRTGRTSNLSGAVPKCNAKFPNFMVLRTKTHQRSLLNPLKREILVGPR